jgi:hypothetical protein
MTTKEVKQWLGRARYIDREIKSLEKALDDARDQATKITQAYDGDPVHGTKDPHKLDRLAEYVDMVQRKRDELISVKREVTEAIFRLQDERLRIVLLDYYVNVMSWEEIAAQMHYCWRYTMKLRRIAIAEMEKLDILCQGQSVV